LEAYAGELEGCLQSIATAVTGNPETSGIVVRVEELVAERDALRKSVGWKESGMTLCERAFCEGAKLIYDTSCKMNAEDMKDLRAERDAARAERDTYAASLLETMKQLQLHATGHAAWKAAAMRAEEWMRNLSGQRDAASAAAAEMRERIIALLPCRSITNASKSNPMTCEVWKATHRNSGGLCTHCEAVADIRALPLPPSNEETT
jgi:hypothetical protein